MFDTGWMSRGRQDIIGDLQRLRLQIAQADSDQAGIMWPELELLAAVAVAKGMSHNIVSKASHVPRDRIDTLLSQHPDDVETAAAEHGYQRLQSGIVTRHP